MRFNLLKHRERLAATGLVLAAVATAEWLRQPDTLWAVICVVAAGGGALLAAPGPRWSRRALAGVLGVLAVVVGITGMRLHRIEVHWPAERERRIEAAAHRLEDDLRVARLRADRLAEEAVTAASLTRQEAFRALAHADEGGGPESASAIFDREGRPWSWGGRHRIVPAAAGDSLDVQASRYYIVLEARRHAADGRTGYGSVLIWTHAAVPERERSLAERFKVSTEVGLQAWPPGEAPNSRDVFDYEQETARGHRILFSARPIPPDQSEARELAFSRGARIAAWVLGLAAVLALVAANTLVLRGVLLGTLLWVVGRAPIGSVLGIEPLFSPATYFLRLFRPFTSSAGVLGLTGALLAVGGIWLWHRRRRGRPALVLAGIALAALTPAAIDTLGHGITTPASGVTTALWVTWQVVLALTGTGLLTIAAALVRGQRLYSAWWPGLGVVLALVAAAVGTITWSPADGWPNWYPFLWLPAVLLAVVPSSRLATVLFTAGVAGSLSAAITWQFELRGRLVMAEEDVGRLGLAVDPLAVPMLDGFADEVALGPPPTDATELYAFWRKSPLREYRYPVQLALWDTAGRPLARLPLDSLDMPSNLIGYYVRKLDPADARGFVPLSRVPGVHHLLLSRVTGGRVLSVAIGPRTALIQPSRLGRLVEPRGRTDAYRLTIAIPTSTFTSGALRWHREGWLLDAAKTLALASGVRDVHALVDLRGPVPLFVRGVLVVLLDLLVAVLLWLLAERLAGVTLPLPQWRQLLRSFRTRLGVTLAIFFILPVIGFSVWSIVRLRDEARRARDLLTAQTLRDASVAAAAVLPPAGSGSDGQLAALSEQIDADLAFYAGGVLRGASAPILRDLGVVDALLPPPAFEAMALRGAIETAGPGPVPELAERVGFRVVQTGAPADQGVLAAPQPGDDELLQTQQVDLLLVVLLAMVAGEIGRAHV